MTEHALGFDPAALRAKYALERARRLRADGLSQYVEVAGAFRHFADDPWADTTLERDPFIDEVDVAIVGAGFGGLLTGARLRELGVQRLRLIDKAADVGGTWYWNRYPGIACDVESYVYMPLLEELGYVPSEKYAKGAEIFEHCRQIARHYDLYRDACLQTEVHEIRWDETDSRWVISTNHGDRIRARFVSMANGYIQRPKLPGIPGIESFGGHAFHTSRWDYAYTGAELRRFGRQAGRAHRNRGDRGAVRSAPRRRRAAPVRLPAHAVDGRRPGQRADRPGLGLGFADRAGSDVASRTSRC